MIDEARILKIRAKTFLAVCGSREIRFSSLLRNKKWAPSSFVAEDREGRGLSLSLAVAVHIFHDNLVENFISSVEGFPVGTKFFVTTPNERIKEVVADNLERLGVPFVVRFTPNRGRNFGPLLVEYRLDLLEFDHFIHVHSKKSPHAPNRVGYAWRQRFTQLFLEEPLLTRLINLARNNHDLGLIYPNSADLIRRINYFWGINRAPLKADPRLSQLWPACERRGPIIFPAGGMFLARTEAVRPILDIEWTYDMFPLEDGQVDGEIQHAVERVFGEVCSIRGFKHGVYFHQADRFTTDETYSI